MIQKFNQQASPLLNGQSIESKRAELKAFFKNTWHTYDSLFSHIAEEKAFYSRPEPLRHPLIFYFGHTATFYINKLMLGKYISQRVNTKIEAICAVGVDEMSWDDVNSENYDWPTVTEVKEYRQDVYQLVNDLIDNMDIKLPIKSDSIAWIILMGCEHERIHLETSSVIMRMLSLEYLTPSDVWPPCKKYGEAPDNQLLTVAGKRLTLGKPDTDTTFGWDNEYGYHNVNVDSFRASKYLVSNQEFMEFMKAGGYQNLQYWTEEGQQWLAYQKPTMPRFWLEKDGRYFQRNLFSEMPLPMDWPVETNHLESKAFCNWKSEQSLMHISLPTEAQWYCLRDKVDVDLHDNNKTPGNINLSYFASSCPVNTFECDEFYDIIGNVWQWTESAIDSFDGFKVHPLYDDFSTPTFDGKHNLIKGGAWISTGNEVLKSSRYAFRRHFFQHAGFRYIETEHDNVPMTQINHYETSLEICQQLDNHYGKSTLSQKNYSQQIADVVTNQVYSLNINTKKLLDLGCSVGRCSFILSDTFDTVDGVDFSARYIQHCVKLQQEGSVRYITEAEGDIIDFNEVTLNDSESLNAQDNVNFSQGDPANLKDIYTGYDVILVHHALENNYDPKRVLAMVSERLAPNGLLVIVSDYKFNEKTTEKSKWLGGIKVNGENVSGFDGLSQELNERFTLVAQQELTRVLKENKRNFNVSKTHLTVWQFENGHV
jgi:5-histidylcysteine sulfoxide synthase/putative 4-mercaptohistidine N1-methyltranferase